MNLIAKTIIAVSAGAMLLAPTMSAQNAIKTEHRSVWVSPFVSDWPSTKLTSTNVASTQKKGIAMIDSLAANNFNSLYFHVRPMSDACYESSYEPWSSTIVNGRGTKPPYDPLQFIIDEGHKKGIEVYAWINPFRYCNSTDINYWGKAPEGSPKNYAETHPEWLLTNASQTILNPGIPEVREHIIKVCKEIVTKYDVDGIVMDDYFYGAGGTDYSLDADLYNKYKAEGGTLSQGDWRRQNINIFIHDFYKAMKEDKPWIRVGISPAGCAGYTAASYGLPNPPGSDWQYNTIYSDPLAWMKAGDLDFMSPQIYWRMYASTNPFEKMEAWWELAAKKFNRHVYPSQSVDDSWDYDEYGNELKLCRQENEYAGTTGYVFFKQTTLMGLTKVVDKKYVKMINQFAAKAATYKAYNPPMNWCAGKQPEIPKSVSHSGNTLSWVGYDNVRYVIYAVPNAQIANFTQQAEYIMAMTYNTSWEIEAQFQSGYTFFVSTLDRYGFESAALKEGESVKDDLTIKITSPTFGGKLTPFNSIRWESNATDFVIEIASDQAMKNVVFKTNTQQLYLEAREILNLEQNHTYYLQIVGSKTGSKNAESQVVQFKYSDFKITYPADAATDVSITPTITWDGIEDCTYVLEISSSADMANVVFEATTANTSVAIPDYILYYGYNYYARLTAVRGTEKNYSTVNHFITTSTELGAPVLLCPKSDGETLHANSKVIATAVPGVFRTRVEIATSSTFPTRTKYSKALTNFTFESEEMNTVKCSSALADGVTYYLRVRYEYYDANNSIVNGPWTTYSFIYSSQDGVESVITDANAPYYNSESNTIVIPQGESDVKVYTALGQAVMSQSKVRGSMSLNLLAKGTYLVSVSGKTLKVVVK